MKDKRKMEKRGGGDVKQSLGTKEDEVGVENCRFQPCLRETNGIESGHQPLVTFASLRLSAHPVGEQVPACNSTRAAWCGAALRIGADIPTSDFFVRLFTTLGNTRKFGRALEKTEVAPWIYRYLPSSRLSVF